MVEQIFENQKVLITGHTGFKGAWLTQWLLLLGARVAGCSLDPPSRPYLFDVLGLEKQIQHYYQDIRHYESLKKVVADFQPRFIFHLAAQPLVRLSYDQPRETFEANVLGTVNLLESARNVESVRAIVVITSDKCYANQEWPWGYRENEPMGGKDPYSASKGCAELVTAAYIHSFYHPDQYGVTHKTAIASARAGNVIGGGDWGADRLIPDCYRALSLDQRIVIRSPQSVRPWQHVLEPLGGYLRLAKMLEKDGMKYSGGWNFGPSDQDVLTVQDVVEYILKKRGAGEYLIQQSHKHEAQMLKLDSSKARNLLGWKQNYNVYEALDKTCSWYNAFYEKFDRRAVKERTIAQIEEYGSQILNGG